MSLSPDIVDIAALDAARQEHQPGVLARRPLRREPALHVVAGAVPRTHERPVPAFQRPAEMHADIGGDTDAAAASIDVNLAAEEGHDDAARLGNLVFSTELVAHANLHSMHLH